MKKRVSLKDIAGQIGVSAALVSYVLTGKEKEARVGKEMASKIKKVAKKLNYQPNLIARGLKFGKTKTIGLIVADISNPFFSSLARIIENEASTLGYTVIFGSSDEQLHKSRSLLDTLLNRQVDGLIITPVEGSQSQIASLQKKGIPVVLIDRGLRGNHNNSVTINNFEASYQAASLLIKNGYHRIGMLAYDQALTHMNDRIRGYKAALHANGLTFNEKFLQRLSYSHIEGDIQKSITLLLGGKRRVVDALLFATNVISILALKNIQKLNIKVPEELGIVSFDESEVYDFFYSPVTYVKQNLQVIGESAVGMLIRQIEEPGHKLTSKITKAEIIIKESCGSNRKKKG